eukprot:SAG11_NODE_2018_length_3916_cov_13.056065_2_plen_394_part_00
MSVALTKKVVQVQSKTRSRLVLTCLLMSSGESSVGRLVIKAEPLDIPLRHELVGRQDAGASTDKCLTSPVFSPMCGTEIPLGGSPDAFDLAGRIEPASAPGGDAELPTDAAQQALLEEAQEALTHGGGFEPAPEGDGVFFLKDCSGKNVGVFKTNDGELQDRSQMSLAIEGGCAQGQRAQRETMAYLYDCALPQSVRAGVPPTLLVHAMAGTLGGGSHLGSLQRFVANMGSSEDWGSSRFGVENVQRIALFDLLTLNLDRHGGNMIVAPDGQLVPIDHGYSLPDGVHGSPWHDWRLWKQANVDVQPQLKAAALGLSPLLAKPIVQSLGLPNGVWQTSEAMTLLLQGALQRGETLRTVTESLMHLQPEQEPELEQQQSDANADCSDATASLGRV